MTPPAALLSIRNLRKEYRPGQPVLKDISLDVDGDGLTAIIGPSGTGKRTTRVTLRTARGQPRKS